MFEEKNNFTDVYFFSYNIQKCLYLLLKSAFIRELKIKIIKKSKKK